MSEWSYSLIWRTDPRLMGNCSWPHDHMLQWPPVIQNIATKSLLGSCNKSYSALYIHTCKTRLKPVQVWYFIKMVLHSLHFEECLTCMLFLLSLSERAGTGVLGDSTDCPPPGPSARRTASSSTPPAVNSWSEPMASSCEILPSLSSDEYSRLLEYHNHCYLCFFFPRRNKNYKMKPSLPKVWIP